MDAGKAPGNKPCVDSMLVTENRKKSNIGSLFCQEHIALWERRVQKNPPQKNMHLSEEW